MLAEDLPGIPLWYPNNEVVHTRRIEGIRARGAGRSISCRRHGCGEAVVLPDGLPTRRAATSWHVYLEMANEGMLPSLLAFKYSLQTRSRWMAPGSAAECT